MRAYRITARVVEVDEGFWSVSATAILEIAPRQGVITRHHECSSRAEAIGFLEILVDQVRSAVETSGGEVVSLVSVE